MAYTITLIPGDGSGPEAVAEAKRCIDATGVTISWETAEAGLEALEKKGDILPQEVLDSIARNRIALKGPLTTPIGSGYRSINVQLRQHFNLFACVRPCKTIRGLQKTADNVDIVVIRENTEDLYAGIEFQEGEESSRRLIEIVKEQSGKDILSDSAISIKPISRSASQRIAEFAFTYAEANKRSKITVLTKSNIMKFTDGLFFEEAQKVASHYTHIGFEHLLIDNACLHLVTAPQEFDVILTPNLYGDIVSDLCAGLVGGLGVAPGANLGEDCAVFEAVHGSAPKYKGKNIINPCALILSGAMLLQHIGEHAASERLYNAVETVIKEGRYVTRDINRQGCVGTKEMADRIIYYLNYYPRQRRCGS